MITHLENKPYGDALRRYAVENSFGMELGPLHHPYVQKTEDRDVMYVDYQSTQKLKEANKDNPQIDIADIVELDYVWAPGTHLPPPARMFDYIVASQVVEHVPDTLGWIKELFSVLKEDGYLVLGVPDKRYTFDAYRHETTLQEVLEAYCRREPIPTVRQIFDNCFYAVDSSDFGSIVDVSVPFERRRKLYTVEEALNFATFSYYQREYIDIHCTVWTPQSFRETVTQLNKLGLLICDLEIVEIPEGASFVAYLRKRGEGRDLPDSYEQRLEKENAHLRKAYDEAVAVQRELLDRLSRYEQATAE